MNKVKIVPMVMPPTSTSRSSFARWELIDLSEFRVRLKAEFEGSNADLYRPKPSSAAARNSAARTVTCGTGALWGWEGASHKVHSGHSNRVSSDSSYRSSSRNISSMDSLKSRATLKASGRLGSYFSVSNAFTVWRETSSSSARSDCDHPLAARNSRSLFFI